MKVKICGITDPETALAAVHFGADAIGLVFAESKRRVSILQAKEIIAALPESIMKVGVFVNAAKEEMERIAVAVGLTHLQLHGDESISLAESLSLPVIKAFSFTGNEALAEIQSYPAEYILLDGPKGKYRGGNGTAFAWSEVHPAFLHGRKIILAGGLHVENVMDAISHIHPTMVDVSSGVETDGKKDLKKIKSFIEKVKTSTQGGNTHDRLYITE